MSILHLLADEKVADHVIDMFESVEPGRHVFLVPSRGPERLRFIRKRDQVICRRFRHWRDCPELRDGSRYEAVISYGMQVCYAGFVAALPRSIKVVWCPGGSEFSKMREFRDQYHADEQWPGSMNRRWKNLVRWFRHDLRHGRLRLDGYRRRAIQRCDYVMMISGPGFQMLKERLHLNATHLSWTYYVTDPCRILEAGERPGRGILVGNAASPANEHRSVFEMLAQLDLQGRKVLAPLSYGLPHYRRKVLRWGQEQLGDRFHPLLDFAPLAEYSRILAGCDIGIFNNQGLQAFGNTIMMLRHGSKVFLREKHSALEFFRGLGLTVFSIEKDLASGAPGSMRPLDEEDIRLNAEIIERTFSRSAVLELTRSVIGVVSSSACSAGR